MPTYTFENEETGEVRDVTMTYEEMKKGYRGESGDENGWVRTLSAPAIKTETGNHFGGR